MLGAVPIYGAAAKLVADGKSIMDMTPDFLFDTIEEQCREGVDYITVHCGVTRQTASLADEKKPHCRHRQPRRITPVGLDESQ